MANKQKGSKFTNYFKGVRAEMKKVIWPDKKELVSYTGAVIAISLAVSIIVALLDFIIRRGLSFII